MDKKIALNESMPDGHIIVKKPWGKEDWYAAVPKKYLGKVLYIEPGQRTSLHYHEKKDETLYVWSGRLVYRYIDEKGKEQECACGFNDRLRVKPGVKHSLGAAHQRVILFEVSTYYPKDSVRVKDYYGRETDG